MIKIVAALFCLFQLMSCASIPGKGTSVSRADYDKVILGQTTSEEVIRTLGKPQSDDDQVLTQKIIDTQSLNSTCGKVGEKVKWITYNYSETSYGVMTINLKNFIFNKKNIACYKSENTIKD